MKRFEWGFFSLLRKNFERFLKLEKMEGNKLGRRGEKLSKRDKATMLH